MNLSDEELRIALEEISRRPPVFSPENFCFPEQIKFIRDPATYKVAVCSRRAGKTIACAVDLLDTALKSPSVPASILPLAVSMLSALYGLRSSKLTGFMS